MRAVPNLKIIVILIAFLCLSFEIFASDNEPDSNQITLPDSLDAYPDSLSMDKNDSTYADSTMMSSLGLAVYFNFYDSLAKYILVERQDLTVETNRSFLHDAGDYLRFCPSNFIVEYELLPMRKTISPFALPGNRISTVFNNRVLHPFEHLPEPNNMVDFNDIPTIQMDRVYNIEGPLGLVFNADNAVSSLIMIPQNPKTTQAESKMVVDKGSFGYANTKAFFANNNQKGRSIRLAAEFRKTEGRIISRDDDAYHQWGELTYPLSAGVKLNFSGRLYRRTGHLPMRPSVGGAILDQSRRDRDFTAGFELDHTSGHRSIIEYRHQRSESSINSSAYLFSRRLDVIDNSIDLSHERIIGDFGLRSGISIDQGKIVDSTITKKRWQGRAYSKIIRGGSSGAVLISIDIIKTESFSPGPSLAVIYTKNSESRYLSGSIGYGTKFPSQYELYLPGRLNQLYNTSIDDYYESGNKALNPEKQLVSNLILGFGKIGFDLSLSLTGGKIFDGIDWCHTVSGTIDSFRTANHDIEFANVSVKKQYLFGGKLHLSGGGSYRYINIDGDSNPPYSPDYQLFTNMEFYHYINKLELHLYTNIDCLYSGPYQTYTAFGYSASELGEDFVVNLKLSFRIKSFRFYYIFQNFNGAEYRQRDDYTIPGRFNYYGFVWEFLD